MAGQSARQAVVEALRRSPGLGVRAVARTTGRAVMTVQYALRSLETDGVIRVRTVGRAKAHYVTGRPIPEPPRLPAQWSALFAFLERHGPITLKQAYEAFPGTPMVTTRYRLRELVARGLAVDSRNGRFVSYEAARRRN